MASVGVGCRPALGHRRALTVGADLKGAVVPGDPAVAAETDADRFEGPDQGGAAGNIDAVGFEKGGAVDQQGDIGGGAADIEENGVVLSGLARARQPMTLAEGPECMLSQGNSLAREKGMVPPSAFRIWQGQVMPRWSRPCSRAIP